MEAFFKKYDLDAAWKKEAECRVILDDNGKRLSPVEAAHIFYPPEYTGRPQYDSRAKALCAVCPVVKQCLDYAISNNEVGVWGGMEDKERRLEANRRDLEAFQCGY